MITMGNGMEVFEGDPFYVPEPNPLSETDRLRCIDRIGQRRVAGSLFLLTKGWIKMGMLLFLLKCRMFIFGLLQNNCWFYNNRITVGFIITE